jgi:hypothetical protein
MSLTLYVTPTRFSLTYYCMSPLASFAWGVEPEDRGLTRDGGIHVESHSLITNHTYGGEVTNDFIQICESR